MRSPWLTYLPADVASGIITRDWRTGFKWRKGNVETFSGDGVQMEKGRCCGIFWRTGFTLAITSYRQATGVQTGDWGSLCWQKGVLRHFLGFKCRGPRIVCAEKISGFKKIRKRSRETFGVQENEKEIRKFRGPRKAEKKRERMIIPSGCVVFRPWLSLCYHLFWYPGRHFSEFVSSPMLTGVVNYHPIRVQIVRLFLVFNHSSS